MFTQNRQLPAIEKQQVLEEAPNRLNRTDRPWQVTIEGDALIARWKWEDENFFAPCAVSDETKSYAFIVVLGENGRWRELDEPDGTAEEEYVFGRDGEDPVGETGFGGFIFDPAIIKAPFYEYLTECGWKKAGWFG